MSIDESVERILAKAEADLREVGGWDNSLQAVPAGGVRSLIESVRAELARVQPSEPVAYLYRWLKIRANWNVVPVRDSDNLAEWNCQFLSPYGLGSDAEDDLDAAIEAAAKSSMYLPLDKQDAAPAQQQERAGSQAALDVLAERQRQISAEGWTPEHDDSHLDGQMASAAACYAMRAAGWRGPRDGPLHQWPWDAEWWKPKDVRSNLVRAGALILAEIERLDRAAAPAPEKAQHECSYPNCADRCDVAEGHCSGRRES